MPFNSTHSAARPGPMLPLGAILGPVQAKYGLTGKARWPVWTGSKRTPVQFQPVPRRVAVKRWHDARRLERQTRKAHHQDGAIGRNGLAVLHALLFDFLNRATGRLDPGRAALAKAACISVRSVDRGLAKLRDAGVLEWIRRCEEEIVDGVYRLRQATNAYFIQAQSRWRDFWQPPETPPPFPASWRATPPLPGVGAMAAQIRAEGGSVAAQVAALACGPGDGLAASLARLLKGITARKP